MEVVPEVKPDNYDWCKHAAPGCGGCKIYSSRPEVCREFSCEWLRNLAFPHYWYPLKSKIVITSTLGPPQVVGFLVDPAYPNRWREEPYISDIKHIARSGLDGREGVKWQTVVVIKDQRIPIIGSATLLRAAK